MDTSKRAVIDLTDSSSSHSLTRSRSFSDGDEECSVSKRRKFTFGSPNGYLDPLHPETAEAQRNPSSRGLEEAPRTSAGEEEERPCPPVPRQNMKSKCSPKKKWRQTMSHPSSLVKVNAALEKDRNKDEKIEELKVAGFDGLLGIKMKKLLSSDIVRYLCNNFDSKQKSFPLPQGKRMSISARDVHRVYGIPMGKRRIDLDDLDKDCTKDRVCSLAKELGITPNRQKFVDLSVLKEKLLKECGCRKKYAKLYILYALGTLLVPATVGSLCLKYAQFLEPISDIKSYNWAGHVVDKLVDALTRFVENNRIVRILGDMHFMVVHYLDHLGDDYEPRGPTCSRWSLKRATKIIKDKAVLATAGSLDEVVEEERGQFDVAQNSSARDTHRPGNEGRRGEQCDGNSVRRIAQLRDREREYTNKLVKWARRLAEVEDQLRLEEAADTP